MKNTIKITPKGAVQIVNGEAAERGTAAYALNLRERDGALACVGGCPGIGQLLNGERVVLADDCGEAVRLLTFLPGEASEMSSQSTPASAEEETTEEATAEEASTEGAIIWHSTIADSAATAVGIKLCNIEGDVTSARSCGNFAVIATTAQTVVLQRLADGYRRLDTNAIRPLVMLSATEHNTVSHQLSEYTFNSPYTSRAADEHIA